MGKWDAPVVEALRKAGRPLGTGELVDAVLGRPHPSWVALQMEVPRIGRRGLIAKRGGKWEIPDGTDNGGAEAAGDRGGDPAE